jgi:hypothetical protein
MMTQVCAELQHWCDQPTPVYKSTLNHQILRGLAVTAAKNKKKSDHIVNTDKKGEKKGDRIGVRVSGGDSNISSSSSSNSDSANSNNINNFDSNSDSNANSNNDDDSNVDNDDGSNSYSYDNSNSNSNSDSNGDINRNSGSSSGMKEVSVSPFYFKGKQAPSSNLKGLSKGEGETSGEREGEEGGDEYLFTELEEAAVEAIRLGSGLGLEVVLLLGDSN